MNAPPLQGVSFVTHATPPDRLTRTPKLSRTPCRRFLTSRLDPGSHRRHDSVRVCILHLILQRGETRIGPNNRTQIATVPSMIIVNTETIPGRTIVEVKGLVQGNTIRAKHLGRDIAAGFKNLVGGELKGYTELLTEARRESVGRMIAQAQQLGANAIVNVRFTTSAVTQGAAELYAYGTAVAVE